MAADSDISDETLRTIQAGAAGVRSAGDAVNARIKAFELWVGKLPGRVETHCTIASDDTGESQTCLALKREGREWTLYRYEYDARHDHTSDWKPLRDASVHEKCFALSKLPNLLAEMISSQKHMVDHAERSVREFDSFAKSLGLKVGE